MTRIAQHMYYYAGVVKIAQSPCLSSLANPLILFDNTKKLDAFNRRLRYFAPSLRMCGESIEMAVLYKDGATS